MGTSSLRPFLQGLCCNSPWNYAVFWRFKHQSEMILNWEDGFYDVVKSRKSTVGSTGDFYLENSNKMTSSNFNSSLLDGIPGKFSVGHAMIEMSNASHEVGKGLVGKTASTGNAQWIHSDNQETDMFDSIFVPEYPDEWLLQFVAGIKTILLVPLIPDGVLQLGSMEVVAEDIALVSQVKDMFESHKKYDAYDREYSAHQLALLSRFFENLDESSTSTTEKQNEDKEVTNNIRTQHCNSFGYQMKPVTAVQDLYNSSVRGIPNTSENALDNDFSWQLLGVYDSAETRELSWEDDSSVLTQNIISKSVPLDEEENPFPYSDNCHWSISGDFVNELMDFNCAEVASEANFIGHDLDSAVLSFLSSPGDPELHAVVGNSNHYSYYPTISGHNIFCGSLDGQDHSYSIDTSGVESAGTLKKEDEMGHRLKAVAPNTCSNSDDNSSDKSNFTSSNSSTKQHLTSANRFCQSKSSASGEEDTIPWSFSTSAVNSQGRSTAPNISAQVSSVESEISALVDNPKQKRKGYNSANPVKLSRFSTSNRKRARSGDNPKPRPRDRQLIQDRIKELRDLVPKSSNCSIDGLLDKTVKHMLFLRSVTDQADKLRHQDLKEETDEKIKETAKVDCNRQKGTSWAVELEGKQQICPIVVKDLDHPGHMLIEILCADHGRFLEIADAIYRLKLTILKGVMEEKSHKSWARFVVKASGNFHRLDIFWPLMKLC